MWKLGRNTTSRTYDRLVNQYLQMVFYFVAISVLFS